MKTILALVLALGAVGTATAQTSVSIGINQPGVYGRVDIGNLPPPPLVYAEPVIVVPPRVVVERPPIYLYVPPGHQKHWRQYCGRYNACGQPVYFVQDRWVRERWEHEHRGPRGERFEGPPGRRWEGDRDDRGHGHGHGHGRGNKHDD